MSDASTAEATRPKSPMVIYPSKAVPGVPAFAFSAPPGWVIDEAPDALVVVRTPEQVDGFWINTIVSHDRVAATVDLEKAAKATWARIQRETPSATATMERLARFGTNVVYLRGVEFDAPQSGRRLAQLQALFMAPSTEGRATNDFFQMITTCTPEQMARVGEGLVEMIGSFRFI